MSERYQVKAVRKSSLLLSVFSSLPAIAGPVCSAGKGGGGGGGYRSPAAPGQNELEVQAKPSHKKGGEWKGRETHRTQGKRIG